MIRTPMRRLSAAIVATVATLALASCGLVPDEPDGPVRVGWAAAVPPLDPAASDSVASHAFLSLVYPSLLDIDPESGQPVPSIAASADWSDDGAFHVMLKSGLVFANGNELTSSDVKFSFERQLALQSEDGAWRELSNLESIEATDATSLVFHLRAGPDAGFPFVLAGPAGLILDEETFFADELTSDDDILDAQPFAGPYALDSVSGDDLTLSPLSGFGGTAAVSALTLRLGADADLAQRLRDEQLDAVVGPLDAESVASLTDDATIVGTSAASGRIRLLAFDLDHMPFGARTEAADSKKALAVRVALTQLVDREALAALSGPLATTELRGFIPDGRPGAAEVFAGAEGSDGGPDPEAAAAGLAAAKVETPVALRITVDRDTVGEVGIEEARALAAQLEADGLFAVDLAEVDAAQLEEIRLTGDLQAAYTSILPVSADPATYLTPYRDGVLSPGYRSGALNSALDAEVAILDPAARATALEAIQATLAAQLPAIPITQGVRLVFSRPGVTGVALVDGLPIDLARLGR